MDLLKERLSLPVIPFKPVEKPFVNWYLHEQSTLSLSISELLGINKSGAR